MSFRTPTIPLFTSILILLLAGICSESISSTPVTVIASDIDAPAVSAATTTHPAQKPAPPPDDHAAEVDALFDFVAQNAPGAAVIVIQDGTILYKQGYGLADRKRRTPNTPQTTFHLASAGK